MNSKLSSKATYVIGNKLYLNITNKCNCACVFCVRQYRDSMAGVNLKYHGREPSTEEIIAVLNRGLIENYSEIVFCGFGEPLMRLETVFEVSKYIKNNVKSAEIRLNTNGLGDLINKPDSLSLLSDYIDSVSVSLNAHNPEVYALYTRPVYEAAEAYQAVLETIKKAVVLGFKTQATIVYGPELDKINVEECEKIAAGLGADFRIRPF